ncbi:MAG: hypothetical protein R3A48_02960 [Polyangiales bacterium]
MPLRALTLMCLLVLPGLRCAEATYVEPDVPGADDAGEKLDVDPGEDAVVKDDVKVPPVDLGEGADAVNGEDALVGDDAGDDAGDLDASTVDVDAVDAVAQDVGSPDVVIIDAGPPDTGVRDTGVVDTGPPDTGVRDTGVVDTGVVDTGVPDTGPTYPPIVCPLLGTPIPITCRSRNGLPPCCGIGGACFCEQASPFGPLCLPCN